MPRRATAKGIYHSGRYWLDWDAKADGTLRTPFLTIFWYEPGKPARPGEPATVGRVRSVSTGTDDEREGRIALLKRDLAEQDGGAFCAACGQRKPAAAVEYYLANAIADYLTIKTDTILSGRLAHVLDYIETLPSKELRCSDIGGHWVAGFREWSALQPVVYTSGRVRVEPRAPSTTENSVIALAAAINLASERRMIADGAHFKSIPPRELNNSPKARLTIPEIARAFRYACDPRFPNRRRALRHYLIAAVSTLGRPDAVHDISTTRERDQWNTNARILALNPKGRRQTKKYRSILPAPWQFALHLDGTDGFFVPVASIGSAWDTMCDKLSWPKDGEHGPKLIRRSMAKLLRDRLPKADWPEITMFLGHDKFDTVSDIYAPFDPNYLGAAKAEIERIIDDIEKHAPGAFHRTNTGDGAIVIPMRGAKNG